MHPNLRIMLFFNLAYACLRHVKPTQKVRLSVRSRTHNELHKASLKLMQQQQPAASSPFSSIHVCGKKVLSSLTLLFCETFWPTPKKVRVHRSNTFPHSQILCTFFLWGTLLNSVVCDRPSAIYLCEIKFEGKNKKPRKRNQLQCPHDQRPKKFHNLPLRRLSLWACNLQPLNGKILRLQWKFFHK